MAGLRGNTHGIGSDIVGYLKAMGLHFQINIVVTGGYRHGRRCVMHLRQLSGCCGLVLALLLLAMQAAVASGLDVPVLSYFQKDAAGYRWMFWQTDQAQPVTFLSASSQPGQIFWDAGHDYVYYIVNGAVYRARISVRPAQAERLTTAPAGAGEIRVLWRDRISGQLRVAAMQAAGERGVTTMARGQPFICTLLEFDDFKGKWRVVARRATTELADDTPGVAVMNDLRREYGVSNQRLFERFSCAGVGCRNDLSEQMLARVAAVTGHTYSDDDLSMWKVGAHRTVLFGVTEGDQPHMTPPVLVVQPDQQSITALPVADRRQLGMAARQSLLLIADERTGAHPQVVDLQTGAVQFSADGWGAVWIP